MSGGDESQPPGILSSWVDLLLATGVQSFMLVQCGYNYALLRHNTPKTGAKVIEPPGTSDSVLSILIPAYNEADVIERTLAQLGSATSRPDKCELVIIDAGCSDDTMEIANRVGPSLGFTNYSTTESTGGRGPAWHAGVAKSKGDFVLMLHADTVLPSGYDQLIRNELKKPETLATAFKFALDRSHLKQPIPGSGVMEYTVGLRSSLFELPFGDQAIAISRSMLERVGMPKDGYPMMEDYELVMRLRRLGASGVGQIVTLPEPALCDPRRWIKNGVWRTNLINQAAMLWYRRGATPAQIFEMYYNKEAMGAPAEVIWLARIAGAEIKSKL
jgi:glycosyltransferase involved in cell wall biosynthesis